MSGQDTSKQVEERLLVLETKVAYQDQIIDDLNAIVTRQQDEMDRLTTDVRKLKAILESIPDEGVAAGEEPPPPHY